MVCSVSIWRSAAEQFDEADDHREKADATAQCGGSLRETSEISHVALLDVLMVR
jgi:hypothetical protein